MKAIMPQIDRDSPQPLYLQLYTYLKNEILNGNIQAGEKLPSLRSLSRSLELSITTIELAYQQLLVEGYINSMPQSGYYANEIARVIPPGALLQRQVNDEQDAGIYSLLTFNDDMSAADTQNYYDPVSFDFVKWKKCNNRVLSDFSYMLFHEGDPQGEPSLRYEITRYLYRRRGISATHDQVVIGAGTQRITALLSIILGQIGIRSVAMEAPGYQPVQNIFQDHGFEVSNVPVLDAGVDLSMLPSGIRTAVYVSPSNQISTGAVMPIARRYELLEWAKKNDSFILEDDYDSELRYFGKPVPPLQSLDTDQRVVYFGSFSSTLFPSIKISYMVLPPEMVKLFQEIADGYTQTCSKTEQLTLAIYMDKGFYEINIKKLRALYSQKLQAVTQALDHYAKDLILPVNTSSGLHMLIEVHTEKSAAQLSREAASVRISTSPVSDFRSEGRGPLISFRYHQIPLARIDEAVRNLARVWQS